MAEKSTFLKKLSEISKIPRHRENDRHSAKCQYFELQFFANILIFIVLIESTIKIWGYRRSCGVTFENFEIFRFFRGPNGGFPEIFLNFFFTKSCLSLLYKKSNNKKTCFLGKNKRNQRYRFGGVDSTPPHREQG